MYGNETAGVFLKNYEVDMKLPVYTSFARYYSHIFYTMVD